MAEDFVNNNQFGLNVKLPTRTMQQIQESAGGLVGGLWDPLFDFIIDSKNQNVFNGSVANEIEKYNLMMFNTGSLLREREKGLNLNLNG